MLIISHKGNLNGPNPDKENHPNYIDQAFIAGFEVEIDVWLLDGQFWLGHDQPQYKIEKNFLLDKKLWLHAKNMKAMFALNDMKLNHMINCFFHQEDDCTLTSQGYIWTYPRLLPLSDQSIAVMPERVPNWNVSNAAGICTDFPYHFKNNINYRP